LRHENVSSASRGKQTENAVQTTEITSRKFTLLIVQFREHLAITQACVVFLLPPKRPSFSRSVPSICVGSPMRVSYAG
jgi:hypothetical protein